MGLDYIWKTMHCSIIRVELHHYSQWDEKSSTDKLMANPQYKKLFKTRVFRWQQMINDSNLGIRVEALESKNLTFKE